MHVFIDDFALNINLLHDSFLQVVVVSKIVMQLYYLFYSIIIGLFLQYSQFQFMIIKSIIFICTKFMQPI